MWFLCFVWIRQLANQDLFRDSGDHKNKEQKFKGRNPSLMTNCDNQFGLLVTGSPGSTHWPGTRRKILPPVSTAT